MAETTSKTTTKKTVAKTATASAKPAEKGVVAAKKPAAAKVAVKKTAAPKAANKAMNVTAEQRYRMVAEAAYYRAEKNQFKSDSVRDWIEAESDIAAILGDKK